MTDMSEVIPPVEHAVIDERLEAWGHWSQRRRGGWNSACGSAEGNYRAPWRQWHYPTAQEMMPHSPNREMLDVDRAVLCLPEGYRELVKCHYFYRLAPRKTMRRLAIHVTAWTDQIYRARQMVINNLRANNCKTQFVVAESVS
jgi:hypothetical protein